jgi:hypothetical protein
MIAPSEIARASMCLQTGAGKADGLSAPARSCAAAGHHVTAPSGVYLDVGYLNDNVVLRALIIQVAKHGNGHGKHYDYDLMRLFH